MDRRQSDVPLDRRQGFSSPLAGVLGMKKGPMSSGKGVATVGEPAGWVYAGDLCDRNVESRSAVT